MQVEDRILFADYKWLVLDIHNNSALILTVFIIEQCAYHDEYR